MVSTAEGIELIAAETGRIKAYLRGTGPDQWAVDSPCEGWTVGDVIGHLGCAAEFFSDAISQGRSGITTAPEGLPEAGSLPPAEIPDFIARMAKDYNQSAGADLAETFSSSVDRLGGIFASMEEDDWSKECWSFRGLQPASAFVNIRISEVVIHYWDIRFPANPNAPLSPDALPVVLERLPVWLNSLGLADFQSSQPEARYRFQTTGSAGFQRDVVASGGNSVEEAHGEPSATLSCDADVLALLVWGRLQPAQVLADGRMTVSAGSGTGEDFSAWLSR